MRLGEVIRIALRLRFEHVFAIPDVCKTERPGGFEMFSIDSSKFDSHLRRQHHAICLLSYSFNCRTYAVRYMIYWSACVPPSAFSLRSLRSVLTPKNTHSIRRRTAFAPFSQAFLPSPAGIPLRQNCDKVRNKNNRRVVKTSFRRYQWHA